MCFLSHSRPVPLPGTKSVHLPRGRGLLWIWRRHIKLQRQWERWVWVQCRWCGRRKWTRGGCSTTNRWRDMLCRDNTTHSTQWRHTECADRRYIRKDREHHSSLNVKYTVNEALIVFFFLYDCKFMFLINLYIVFHKDETVRKLCVNMQQLSFSLIFFFSVLWTVSETSCMLFAK